MLLKQESLKSHKIGLYIRVSTEEQASNPEGSIRNQEDRLLEIVKLKNTIEGDFGVVVGIFTDRARSGKDTNRPELQRLLTAIQEKEINLVIVSELSRLSRSMKDFSEMWEMMRNHGCGILSLRENFDTTTAAGEMVLYTIANIAQFERRQTAERISANFIARAERGLSNGGRVPVGYRLDPDKKGNLLIDEEKASTVRLLFDKFLELGTLTKTAQWFNLNGYQSFHFDHQNHKKLGLFTIENLQYILRNKAYVGTRAYRIAGKSGQAKATWEPIIEPEKFNLVQEILSKNKNRFKPHTQNRYPYLLSGLTTCGVCGDVLVGKSANGNGGKIAYYEHGWAIKRQSGLVKKVFTCKGHMRVLAKKLEPIVWENICQLLQTQTTAKLLLEEAQNLFEAEKGNTEIDSLKRTVKDLENQIEALAKHLTQIPGDVSPEPIFKQMKTIQSRKEETEKRLQSILRETGTTTEAVASLNSYESFLNHLKSKLPKNSETNPELCRDIIHKLIHRVEVFPNGLKIYFYVGKTYIGRYLDVFRSDSVFSEKNQNLKNSGSSNLTNGGPCWTRTNDHPVMSGKL